MEFEINQPLSPPKFVVDDKDATYHLTAMLGEGGQGSVWRTDNKLVAVKLIYRKGSNAEEETRALESRLKRINARQLWRWPIARPIAVLKPMVQEGTSLAGYVMKLELESNPLRELLEPAAHPKTFDQVNDWYRATGGLRRRLILLASVAETLAWLNGIPLVYADVSPDNVLIPKDPAGEGAFLIDPDNIGLPRGDGAPPDAGTPEVQNFATDPYAAPEVMNKTKRPSTLTDRFAFAVMAFKALTWRHPFIGDAIEDGPASDLDKAYRGELPWIDDPDDESNLSERGIYPPYCRPEIKYPRQIVLSGRMRGLAQKTFGPGRRDPLRRPGMCEWADAFRRGADLALPCRVPTCRATFYPEASCPWCGTTRDGFASMQVYTWVAPIHSHDDKGQPVWAGGIPSSVQPHHHAIIPIEGFRLARWHAHAGGGPRRNETVAKITYDPQGLHIVPARDVDLWEDSNKLTGPTHLPWKSGQPQTIGPIHFGPPDVDHRVAWFFHYPAP